MNPRIDHKTVVSQDNGVRRKKSAQRKKNKK